MPVCIQLASESVMAFTKPIIPPMPPMILVSSIGLVIHNMALANFGSDPGLASYKIGCVQESDEAASLCLVARWITIFMVCVKVSACDLQDFPSFKRLISEW